MENVYNHFRPHRHNGFSNIAVSHTNDGARIRKAIATMEGVGEREKELKTKTDQNTQLTIRPVRSVTRHVVTKK